MILGLLGFLFGMFIGVMIGQYLHLDKCDFKENDTS